MMKTILLLTLVTLLLFPFELGQAAGVGYITQIGLNNIAYAYQELRNESIVLQLGDDNTSSLSQIGLEQLGANAQVGDGNKFEAFQFGYLDTLIAFQLGFGNKANVSQYKIFRGVDVAPNDAFIYQSGLSNLLNILQLNANNTASLYQMDNNNELDLIQEHWLEFEGENASLIAQSGQGNLSHSLQIGGQQLLIALQLGNDNLARTTQVGTANRIFLSQEGGNNKAMIVQSNRGQQLIY